MRLPWLIMGTTLANGLTVSLEAALSSVAKVPAEMEFILGSSSSSRKQLLSATGAKFETMNPDIDEKAIGDRQGDAEMLVRPVATAKADALVPQLPSDHRILITGDQVVTYDGAIREKPRDLDECRSFIRSYSKKPCSTVGAICLHSLRTGQRIVGVHEASVYFSEIPDSVIDDLIENDGPTLLKCAGGLMVEHPKVAPFITEVTALDSIMGLDTHLLVDLLKKLN